MKARAATAKQERKRPARPIRTRRDYESAAAVAKRMSEENSRSAAAELRLQSLLRELDKFETPEDELDADLPDEYPSDLRRRWTDEDIGDR